MKENLKDKINLINNWRNPYKLSDNEYVKSSHDQFKRNWIDEDTLLEHSLNGKNACIVSPELHGREYKTAWKKYRNIIKKNTHLNFIICTDFPEKARSYFE